MRIAMSIYTRLIMLTMASAGGAEAAAHMMMHSRSRPDVLANAVWAVRESKAITVPALATTLV